jgi:4-amino-4-deoxy-L-arabinose transferase-like glycosyltransferase
VTDHIREALLVGGLIALALALRFLGLAEGDFWGDELATRDAVADRTPSEVLTVIQEREGAPHPYYLLAWAWAGILGAGEAGLRSLSAIAGALVAPVAYLTLRQVDLRTEALIAGALAAVSPLLVWYSQEARVYSLFALLTAVALLFFVRVLVNFSTRALIGWSIAAAATLLTHYFAIFTIAGMATVLLYRHRAHWRPITLSLLPTAIAGFALQPTIAAQRVNVLDGNPGWVSQIPLSERLLQLPEHLLTGLAYPPLPVVLVAGLLAAIGGAAVVIHDQRGRLVGGGLLGVLAVSVALPILAKAANQDFAISRYLLGAIVPLFLAVGVGLGAVRFRPVGLIVALTMVCLLAVTSVAGEYDDEVERPSWGAAANAIAEGDEPDMVLACCGVAASPAAYYLGSSFDSYNPAMGDVEVKEVVLAKIERPDHRPEDDFCWWGSPCLAEDPLGPGGSANPGALSNAFASAFDDVETSERGPITIERYRSSTPVSLGPQGQIRLAEDEVIVGDDIRNSVELQIAPGLAAE